MRVFKADPRECERATLRLLGGGDGGGGSFEGTPADCLLVQQCGCNIATAQLQWHPFILLTIRVRARAYALCTWRYVIQMQSASGHINNAFINFTLTHGRASERASEPAIWISGGLSVSLFACPLSRLPACVSKIVTCINATRTPAHIQSMIYVSCLIFAHPNSSVNLKIKCTKFTCLPPPPPQLQPSARNNASCELRACNYPHSIFAHVGTILTHALSLARVRDSRIELLFTILRCVRHYSDAYKHTHTQRRLWWWCWWERILAFTRDNSKLLALSADDLSVI